MYSLVLSLYSNYAKQNITYHPELYTLVKMTASIILTPSLLQLANILTQHKI